MFLITEDMLFFFHGDIELQRVRSDENSILWYCSVDYSPSQSPTKTLYIRLVFVRSGTSVFLDLVLLSCTPVATNSFSCSSLQSSYTATLSSTCFWLFLPSGIQSGEETDVGTFTLLVFRNKQGAWHKGTQLMKGFDFPFTTTKNSIRLIFVIAIFYWQSNTFTRTAFKCEDHIKRLLWGLKQVLDFNLIPLRTNFDTQTTVISHRRRKRFSFSAG